MGLTAGKHSVPVDNRQTSADSNKLLNWKWFAPIGGLLTVGVLYFALGQPIQVLPLLDPVPAFELTDHRNDAYRSFERPGRTMLYAFAATRDGAYFATLIDFLLRAQAALDEAGWNDRIDMTIMTIDPEHDNVDVLRSTLSQMAIDSDQITLLTGPPIAMKLAVGTGFGVYYERPRDINGDLHFTYDARLILVDGEGIMRARYDMQRLEVERLIRDLNLLFTEDNADGVAQIAYSAAHFFLCFPR